MRSFRRVAERLKSTHPWGSRPRGAFLLENRVVGGPSTQAEEQLE